MTISYHWLCDYLPVKPEPEKLVGILNSIGLEVEGFEKYQEIPGGLKGLVIGEVMEVTRHPNADKLSLTRVDIGGGKLLSIVCGAPNVASGQKVVVAPVGTTIYPKQGEPMTMKLAKIRGSESEGMICAEDEIGIGSSHEGILVLPVELRTGTPAAEYFKPYEDFIYEIGLTPNRSDAMSHLGVARDICAYLTQHENKEHKVKTPYPSQFKPDNESLKIAVKLENPEACPRYSGVSITEVKIGDSPLWMQQRLKAIGVRPINNIVDITNYVLHETGQPLHAFDADAIKENLVIVKNLPEGTSFISLDEKERKLGSQDLMICNGLGEGMCIGGVFGGAKSGVNENTRRIFLESAWFSPVSIRKTSLRHNLRTDAAVHFEKGVDIGNTVNVLKRAALLMKELAGGKISSGVVDVYPEPAKIKEITLRYHYLKKISGKNYHPLTVKNILESLGFRLLKESIDELTVSVPLHKTDVSLPADLAEEVMRIDGFDNIPIPSTITITPSLEEQDKNDSYRQRFSGILVGLGFREILTNSIVNSAWYDETERQGTVQMINNLSADLNTMRPSMLETGLKVIEHNLNRRNFNLRLFEFGKTYHYSGPGNYVEKNHLSLYLTGKRHEEGWKKEPAETDLFYLKGILNMLFEQAGINTIALKPMEHFKLRLCLSGTVEEMPLVEFGKVNRKVLDQFDIRQDVWFADIDWDQLMKWAGVKARQYREIPRFPSVQRDLALVVDKSLPYEKIEKTLKSAKLSRLSAIRLFDIFESEKLGHQKKSMAISLVFQDEDKTLTDSEIDAMMQKIITTFEKELQAEIRK